jgi:hypothetical protein
MAADLAFGDWAVLVDAPVSLGTDGVTNVAGSDRLGGKQCLHFTLMVLGARASRLGGWHELDRRWADHLVDSAQSQQRAGF